MKTIILTTAQNAKLGLLGTLGGGVSFGSFFVFAENAARFIGTLAGAVAAVVSLWLLLKKNRLWPFNGDLKK